LEAKYVN
jgi:ABC-type branched-subunit amino acid transport system ATPase component